MPTSRRPRRRATPRTWEDTLELGVGTLAYGIAAGASLGLVLVFLTIAQHRRGRDRVLLAFGVVAITHGLNAIATVRLQKSSEVAEYADLLKTYGLVNLLVLVSFVTLLVVMADGVSRGLLSAFYVAALVIGFLQVLLPEGLLAADIVALRDVTLFGEAFVVHDGSSSAWRPALDAFLVLTLVVVGTTLWRSFRTKERSLAIVLAVCVTISVTVGAYDSLVDEGITSTPYLAPFGDLAIAVMAGAYLARQMATTERRLQIQAVELEGTVAARTAALLEANEQLEDSLARQRRSTHQLAALAGQFEAVNSLTLVEGGRSEITSSLEEVVANLGRLVDASSLSLRLDELVGSAEGNEPILWSSSGASDDDHSLRPTFVAPLVVRGRMLGELAVEIGDGEIDEERRRYVELTAEHLAGFVERADLVRHIAATAVESERERITQELHDSVTQKLYSVSFLTEAVQSQLPAEQEEAARTVGRMHEILLSSLAELRTLMFELHPSTLETTRLTPLLQQLCDTFTTSSPLTVNSTIADGDLLPTDVRIGLYRIAQEALSNAARHSAADAVEVELHRVSDGVELCVSDAGRGFDVDDRGTGYGLGTMQRRADLIGADLTVTSAPGRGTTVVVSWAGSGTTSLADTAEVPDRPERSNA